MMDLVTRKFKLKGIEHMYNFDFYMPTKVLFGAGKLQELHTEVLPGKKALIVTSNGSSTKKFGYLDALEKELDLAGVTYEIFDEIRPNPTNRNIMDGAMKAKKTGCEFVVALGGGSVMDSSKCIALMMTNTGDIWDYSYSVNGGKKNPEKDAAPIVAITTSAGTGSEVDCCAVLSNDEVSEKSGFLVPSMFPVLSVVDSNLMMSVPPKFTAFQGMDAFFHAAESVINKNEHPMGEMFALKAIELIAANLPVVYRDGSNQEARANMALANSLAGYYMLITSAHTMEHTMGSYHENLIHGAGLIMISHDYYDFFAERKAAEEQMIKMAKAMGVENPTSGKDFIRALDELIEAVGCKDLRMSDSGIKEEELAKYPKRIHEVLGGDITADPLPLTDEDYLEIYKKSYR
ncbi:iron-containing alcohol dehydrogenase [Clostridium saccharobutylicum]|uniref:1,3-propanediol dehydrogenase DhaT n=1 Tax=Clostridium saccharobutylicum DSM 13864 TaxID=1345695 RepID=U5MVF2_CLOSA|nr:iron-containing alcohol dehydrogenase [Clostridium saccharobutylicum]AGX44575.1 1,3-propanediol dehydrogenase DhaT [Clostridium saccharobutylicum DSM 13864]AQR91866.1 1,3-propanediol dehydrogenase [Clostridium saccharobutylicum]AQS01768.1 1,3-propanediol dehydrogenase [Clostridium saccharobutylicum]AQS15751.1 1,3-propanediol dehydrogenase [Clostridium saccharobutylicum]MBA2906560.1 alcohol dehydrogenase [Clostridium saccharobutylicum]